MKFFERAHDYLVGVDPTESLDDLSRMIPEGFVGWVTALPSPDMLVNFNV